MCRFERRAYVRISIVVVCGDSVYLHHRCDTAGGAADKCDCQQAGQDHRGGEGAEGRQNVTKILSGLIAPEQAIKNRKEQENEEK